MSHVNAEAGPSRPSRSPRVPPSIPLPEVPTSQDRREPHIRRTLPDGLSIIPRSPGRSKSYSSRRRDKSPSSPHYDYHLQPGTPSTPLSPNHLSPTSSSGSHSSPMRRAFSQEPFRREYFPSVNQYRPGGNVPPSVPPKDTPLAPSGDPLLAAARAKMSSQDQEAMRKLRSTMMELSDSGSSHGGRSPSSPGFPSGGTTPNGRDPRSRESSGQSVIAGGVVRSRRSTLSKQVVPDDRSSAEELLDQEPVPQAIERRGEPSVHRSDPTHPQSALTGPDYVIAVTGNRRSGKSTVIKRATKAWGGYDARLIETSEGVSIPSYRSDITPASGSSGPARVQFLELNLDVLRASTPDRGIWPEGLPKISGVAICYDATDRTSLEGVPEALRLFAQSGLAVVMFACKTEPGATLEVAAVHGNSIAEPYNVGLIEVNSTTSEGKNKTRNGLRWLLYKLDRNATLERQRRKDSRDASSSLSSSVSLSPRAMTRLLDGTAVESDASETIGQLVKAAEEPRSTADGQQVGGEAGEDKRTSLSSRSSSMRDKRSSGGSMQWMTGPPVASAGVEKGDQDSPVKIGTLELGPAPTLPTMDAPLYLSMEDLSNQLLTAIVSNEDGPFVKAFFLTYRRFCHPRELMTLFLERIKEIEQYAIAKDIRHWTIQKLTGALIDWTSRYPGDLADEATQAVFRETVAHLFRHAFMSHLTADLVLVENALSDVHDVDQSWSLSAKTDRGTEAPSMSCGAVHRDEGELLHDINSSVGPTSGLGTPSSFDQEGETSVATSSSLSVGPLGKSTALPPASQTVNEHDSTGSSQVVSGPRTENSEHSPVKSLVNNDPSIWARQPDLGFSRWYKAYDVVMTMDPRILAAELTKLQWEIFSAIRPRDVLRHDVGKEKDDPVGKAIQFFNHVSKWTSTVILAHPKAKHRARVYERFMALSHQLRRLNNYDTLYAIISGMRETSVLRLSQTHSLIQVMPSLEKDYQSHLKLLNPNGGYTNYRRAIAADLSHGRSAIPLLTNILGLINRLQSVRREDVRKEDGFVQWSKFAKFGEILTTITDCQALVPMVKGAPSPAVSSVLLDTPVIDDEDSLYERSRMLESVGNGGQGNVFRRFGKLAF